MRRLLLYMMTTGWLTATFTAAGQDPNFSQFFSSPLNINPALTSNINADWRMISNFRTQWIGPGNPYITGTVSYDRKVLQRKMAGVEQDNHLGIGAMLMYDHAMSGILKSTYASFNLAYHLKLSEGRHTHRLGGGLGGIYGRRMVDYNRLTFEDQWTGLSGFNTNLPTGEASLSNMRPYFSATAGLLYNVYTDKSNLDIGVASFHLNEPKQTFLDDENQRLARRNVIHANYERYISDELVLNVNAVYQYQAKATYHSMGAAVGYYLPSSANVMLTGGLWYWSANALVPYFGVSYGDWQIGMTYDLTISKLRNTPRKPNTFELSLILRGEKAPRPGVPCPWR